MRIGVITIDSYFEQLREAEEKVHKPVDICSNCDAVLYDGDGDCYCSKEGIGNLYGLEEKVLEYLEE